MADARTGQVTRRWCACCAAWIDPTDPVDHAYEDDPYVDPWADGTGTLAGGGV